jgi:hypothetical protein
MVLDLEIVPDDEHVARAGERELARDVVVDVVLPRAEGNAPSA